MWVQDLAMKLFQMSPHVSDFQIRKQLRKKIYFTHICSFVYHLHITENDTEKKIWTVELLLYLVYTNFRR